MKREAISDTLSLLGDDMIGHTERIRDRRRKARGIRWQKWAVVAAGFCAIYVAGAALPYALQDSPRPSDLQDSTLPPAPASPLDAESASDPFVPFSSLLAENGSAVTESAERYAWVPIGQYTAIYTEVVSAADDALPHSKGTVVPNAGTWYAVSGHTDLQYLIQAGESGHSLWKFKCFDEDAYPYSDVLELIYGIDSASGIVKVQVNPARMDNTDTGIQIQKQIGVYDVTDRDQLDTIYQILSSLTCYGENHWDMIDYGDAEADADTGASSHEAVWQGRYLTLITDYGEEIDSLKYTAVSGQFYEFSGIAYGPLTREQAGSIREILRIEIGDHDESLLSPEDGVPTSQAEKPVASSASSSDTTVPSADTRNTDITLEYVTELQERISEAMMNNDLRFVSSSAVYENPYRLHVVVSTHSESDLEKLKAFDTVGGALEIEHSSAPNSLDILEVQEE